MAPENTKKGLLAEWIPVDPEPQLEADLVAQLSCGEADPEKAAFELAQLCSRTGRQRDAVPHLERAADALSNPEVRASLRLTSGQLMEQAGDFHAASLHYERGLAEPIRSPQTRYFLHNNLAFSLNELSLHEEAVQHCQKAIEIEPKRHNAVKNLAIAWQHLGNFAGAARAYILAARLAPDDPRALMHLNDLIEDHPELYSEVKDLRRTLDELLSKNWKRRNQMN